MSRPPTIIPEWDSNRAQSDPAVVLSPFAPGSNFADVEGARNHFCAREGCSNEGMKECGRCHSAKYCSRECQTEDWKAWHKQSCQHPDARSTWAGVVPASWLAPLSPATPRTLHSPRLVYNQGRAIVEHPLMSMASRPSLCARLENHPPETDGSFDVCISEGQGAFIDLV
jgi:hypothetical protein